MRIAFALVLIAFVGFGVTAYSLRAPKADLVWGKHGVAPGELARPRATVIIGDTLFIVDFSARIQSYDLDGHHTGLTFTTPDYRNGRPSGLGVDNRGHLIVSDSHYHCVRIYDENAKEEKVLTGDFGYVSDCVQDEEGFYYVSEFGQRDRITKLDADGKVVSRWGEAGSEPGQLQRTRALAFGPDGNLYVVDACNHRVQVFTREGKLVRIIGEPGSGLGQFHLPYDIAFGPDGGFYVVERGNSRVQKFDKNGNAVAAWGCAGHGEGQLADPWALAVEKRGRVHVIDTENHRVQRIRF